MSGPVAMRTFQPIPFALFPDHCCRHNPRRDGDNRIADQHHDRRQETSDGCHRRYIAIADGRHRHDRPIDTVRNIIELRTGLVPFYHIHDRTDRSHQNQDKKEKHEYLRCTDPKRFQQHITFFQEVKQLKDTKNADQPKRTNHKQVARAGKEKTQIDRQCRQQIHNPEKAENIFFRIWRAIDTNQVFKSEESRKHILQYP